MQFLFCADVQDAFTSALQVILKMQLELSKFNLSGVCVYQHIPDTRRSYRIHRGDPTKKDAIDEIMW